ncbi:MAG: formylglycine-generating enzyme family protein [Chlorobi bacterium]|nr:formylglycine-generating enzyme family protein [Chlorobiota bacterium]
MKTINLLAFLLSVNILSAQNKIPETVLIEGGTFKMGIGESKYFDEFPVHTVKINDFYIGKYEVTIEEFTGFCRTAGLDLPEGDPKMPITNVSWEEACMYCNWLSRLARLDKCYKIIRNDKTNRIKIVFDKNANGYRLPTEAEWEYVARGGNSGKHYAYCGSNNPDEVAWYAGTGKMLHPVGEKKPNPAGVYDMSGNAQEWVFDVYTVDFYKTSPQDNPVNEKGGINRVSRGGSFNSTAEGLRISKRYYNAPDFKAEHLGFRIAKNK